jgi:hypothetical protein
VKIAVLGTGTVGRTLAAALAAAGHEVTVGTRDVATTLSRTAADPMGNPPFADWRRQHQDVGVETLAEAAAGAQLVINALSGAGSLAGLEAAGERNLGGKVLIDVADPLDSSRGMPPSLSVSNTDSLGEQIQRRFPGTRVVKALNTVNAGIMVDPAGLRDGDHTVFVSGDDATAKAQVVALLESLGWTDIMDLGDITTARGTEMYLALWVRLFGVLGTPAFSIKVVR